MSEWFHIYKFDKLNKPLYTIKIFFYNYFIYIKIFNNINNRLFLLMSNFYIYLYSYLHI